MADLGPLYPFVGWEMLHGHRPARRLDRLAHRADEAENRTHDDEARMLRQGDNLQKALQAEHTIERM